MDLLTSWKFQPSSSNDNERSRPVEGILKTCPSKTSSKAFLYLIDMIHKHIQRKTNLHRIGQLNEGSIFGHLWMLKRGQGFETEIGVQWRGDHGLIPFFR